RHLVTLQLNKRYERVVLRVHDQRRNPYAVDDSNRARFVIIVRGISKTPVRRYKGVVVLSYSPRALQASKVVFVRVESRLALQTRAKTHHKPQAVDSVRRPLDRIGAQCEVDRRTNGAHSAHLRRDSIAAFSRKLEHDVAAQRESRNIKPLEPVLLYQLANN